MSTELDAFADSVRQLLAHHVRPDSWTPGNAIDDHNPELTAALADVGWKDLCGGGIDALPFLGAAAIEMGRVVSPFSDVVSVLGGSPFIDGLVMYGASCGTAAVPGSTGFTLSTVLDSRPVNFADALDVHLVAEVAAPVGVDDAVQRIASWETATLGYLAGLTDSAVSQAVDYSRERRVFGKPLAQIETVQQRLADAATARDSLVLSAREGASGLPALAHATASVGGIMAHCHQVFGAIGFTLEFPMQRYSRRAKALGSFANAWIEQRLDVIT